MIRYRIKNRTIELEYDTGAELKFIKSLLDLADLRNELRGRKKIDDDKFETYKRLPILVGAYQTEEEEVIETLDGTLKANKGDYIIKGINGEYYPCKPDIFELTYKKVEQ